MKCICFENIISSSIENNVFRINALNLLFLNVNNIVKTNYS